MGKQVKISFVADTRKLARAFNRLDRLTGLKSFRRGVINTAKTFVAFGAATAAVAGATGYKVTNMAADFEQSAGMIDDVFKGAAGTMHKFAEDAASTVGLASNQYNELAGLLGTQLKNAMGGASADLSKVSGKTDELIKLGADLSAMFGGDTKNAVEAISSALKGERDPIERYGVSLRQAAIDAKAAELGFKKVGGSFNQEAQSAATLALIMEQTADAHGKFARESDTLAHKKQVLAAKIQNLATKLGMKLLPIVSKVVGFIDDNFQPAVEKLTELVNTYFMPAWENVSKRFQTDLLPVLKKAVDVVKEVIQGFTGTGKVDEFGNALTAAGRAGQKVKDILKRVSDIFSEWWPVMKPFIPAIAAFAGTVWTAVKAAEVYARVVQIAKAAQLLFNAALTANPIGAVITAIAALVAAIVYLYNTNEDFRTGFLLVWAEIKNTAVEIWAVIGPVITAALHKIKAAFVAVMPYLLAIWNTVWSAIKAVVVLVWPIIKTVIVVALKVILFTIVKAVAAIKAIWNFWSTLPAKVSHAWAVIKTGVSNGVSNAVNTIRSLPRLAVSALGNIGSVLTNAGKNLIRGLIRGITAGFGWVKSKLSELTNLLPSWKGPADKDKRLLTPAGHLIMQSLVDGFKKGTPDVKRQLNSLTREIGSWDGPVLNAQINANASNLSANRRGSNPAGNVYNIEVKAWKADAQTGQEIVRAIKEYEKVGGR